MRRLLHGGRSHLGNGHSLIQTRRCSLQKLSKLEITQRASKALQWGALEKADASLHSSREQCKVCWKLSASAMSCASVDGLGTCLLTGRLELLMCIGQPMQNAALHTNVHESSDVQVFQNKLDMPQLEFYFSNFSCDHTGFSCAHILETRSQTGAHPACSVLHCHGRLRSLVIRTIMAAF